MIPITDLDPALRSRALEWLTVHATENLGAEITLRADAARRKAWRSEVLTSEASGGIAGVSLLSSTGLWFLHAADRPACDASLASALAAGPVTKANAAGSIKRMLRAGLAERGVPVVREHDLLVMRCARSPNGAEGRWAGEADCERLDGYQVLYNQERGGSARNDWAARVRAGEVAVLERDRRIVSVVCRSGATPDYACIGGTFTFPGYRQRGLGRRLCAFLVAELLRDAPAVQLIVDDDNDPAIALYRSLGFRTAGSCYMAYLDRPTGT
ncbi:MAG: GNAT family N-acetyltransferase [bacterium]|nr:GNAT family N-acetyltransferase [bacterium]